MSTEVTIPDIGDAEDVEVIEICVAAGDTVAENDALIVIESEKASMEVPAPAAGEVAEVLVALGDHVNAGDAILRLAATAGAAPAPAEEPAEPEAKADAAQATAPPQSPASPAPQPVPEPASAESAASAAGGENAGRVYAGPAVRRLARELGAPLTAIAGSGAGGRILKDDVKAFVKQTLAQPAGGAGLVAVQKPIDFSRFGPVETVPLTRIRRRGAANLHASWQQVVHVTQHDEADATELEAFRRDLQGEAEAAGAKLTPLPFLLKASVHALAEHPQFNASLDAAVENLIHKRYYHLGMAVDTEGGLVVPVIRNADAHGLLALAQETARLAQAARDGRLKPDELQGGSFTISSLGNLGGTGFTPIVNAPEVAILGVGRLQTRPHWDGRAFVPRKMLPLSLSYDHRAINGAEAGRFMATLTAALADIRRMLL